MVGLSLEGGGIKGSYQAGAYLAFKKCHIKFDGVVGTSIGSLNGAMIASNDGDAMVEMWKNLDVVDALDFEQKEVDKLKKKNPLVYLDFFGDIIKNKGISTEGIKRIVEKNIDFEKLKSSNIDYGLCTVRVKDFKPVYIMKDKLTKSNLNKYGCEWVRTYNKDARSISRTCQNKFDKILLDAPCSSYSHFGDGFVEKSAKEIKLIARLQKQLLNSALSALKPGGVVVYSTCTFFERENEEVVQNALNSNFKIKLISLDFGLENQIKTELGTRILPDNNMSGFFIAKLIKES